jgi:hypothetical protein
MSDEMPHDSAVAPMVDFTVVGRVTSVEVIDRGKQIRQWRSLVRNANTTGNTADGSDRSSER